MDKNNNPLRGGNIKPSAFGWWGKFKTSFGQTVEAVGATISELFRNAAQKANIDNGNSNQ